MAPDKSLAAEIEAVTCSLTCAEQYLIEADFGAAAAAVREASRLLEAQAAEIAALQSREGLIAFAREIIGYAFDGMDADGADIQALALAHGLLVKEPYDPKKHGPSMEAEPGDEWYVLAGPLALPLQPEGERNA